MQTALPFKRDWRLAWSLGGLGVLIAALFWRQHLDSRLGGELSPAKALWLGYALGAWFLVAFTFYRSPRVAPALRRVYGAHLLSFAVRAAVELPLMAFRAWIPPYGMVHDLFTAAVITLLLRSAPPDKAGPGETASRTARRFLTSIRLGILCDGLFAWLFYQAVRGDTRTTWFAGSAPEFALINTLTWTVVVAAYLDLARVLREGREALFPILPRERADG